MGVLVEDFKCLLLHFVQISFIKVDKHCNKVSKALACEAQNKEGLEDWIENCLPFSSPHCTK